MKSAPLALSVLLVASLAAVCVATGCGTLGGSALDLPQLGFSMQLPSGWKVDETRSNGATFHAPSLADSFGSAYRFPLERASLEEYLREGRVGPEGTTPTTVGGHEAIEYIQGGTVRKGLRVYIRKESHVFEVEFWVGPQDFSTHEESLRKAIHSIELR
jgi:hypothetical protein